jgi:phosphoglycolate phosphatase-like HAD superfamily hydrolase
MVNGELPMSKAEFDQLLSGVAQLETTDLERFAEQVYLLLAQRKVPSLPQSEAELLQQINHGLREATQHRYNELRTKLQAETITPEEYQELLTLVDIVEQAEADRLQHLIELSQLRQVPLPSLIQQLGIHPPAVHH